MRLAALCLLFTTVASSAQTICDSLPIAYDPMSAVFTGSDMSFGDSVITVNVTNTSTVPMAYPQLKLVPVTPLPPGMEMTIGWSVFSSSWNPGQTSPASIYFDVAQPIPPDAQVTFQVWATNLTPLLVDDSCRFVQDLTINLNPSAQGILESAERRKVKIWPQPAINEFAVEMDWAFPEDRLELWCVSGRAVRNLSVKDVRDAIPVGDLQPGTYQLLWRRDAAVLGRSPVLVLR
jgi:hypothetical protein